MALLVIICIVSFVISVIKDMGWDNCNAHNVDYSRMSKDQAFISKSELKRRYKGGYYNRK